MRNVRGFITGKKSKSVHLTMLEEQRDDILEAIESNKKAIAELEKTNKILHELLSKNEGP